MEGMYKSSFVHSYDLQNVVQASSALYTQIGVVGTLGMLARVIDMHVAPSGQGVFTSQVTGFGHELHAEVDVPSGQKTTTSEHIENALRI